MRGKINKVNKRECKPVSVGEDSFVQRLRRPVSFVQPFLRPVSFVQSPSSDTPSSSSSEDRPCLPRLPRRCSDISSSMLEVSRSSVPSLVFLDKSDQLSSSLSRLAISNNSLLAFLIHFLTKHYCEGSLNSSAGDLVTSPAISTGHTVSKMKRKQSIEIDPNFW